LPIHQHSFGGISNTSRQREIHLHAPLSLEKHTVNLGYLLAAANHVAGGTTSER
jgi:predicted DNA-binding protein with PD1-like motif